MYGNLPPVYPPAVLAEQWSTEDKKVNETAITNMMDNGDMPAFKFKADQGGRAKRYINGVLLQRLAEEHADEFFAMRAQARSYVR
ncbi:hypothetical protein [Bacterioplanoides sp.]|uniref:hypothetical protein n=1 Tax=Bacterioplanoides sp. TaxID=2066072 RepID=UPI003AFF6E0B